MTQIPKQRLIEGRWYAGRGRNANVALWGRTGKGPDSELTFLTVGFTHHNPVVKNEDYWMNTDGSFQPFLLIDEGTVTRQAVETKPGWDKHYAVEMTFLADVEHRVCIRCGQDFQIVRKGFINTCPTCDDAQA